MTMAHYETHPTDLDLYVIEMEKRLEDRRKKVRQECQQVSQWQDRLAENIRTVQEKVDNVPQPDGNVVSAEQQSSPASDGMSSDQPCLPSPSDPSPEEDPSGGEKRFGQTDAGPGRPN